MPSVPSRSDSAPARAAAIWLFAVAALVFVMIVVGGATRLTDSGLSITEWRPITGAIPPLSTADWASEFAKYQATPEYREVNAGMALDKFKTIYWWEWGHRLLGRLIGAAYALPFIVLLATRRIPRRLQAQCFVLLALGGLQGVVGWWMVTSGLSNRVDVAPERLTVHLGLALVLFMGLVWTGLQAWTGPRAGPALRGWAPVAVTLLALTYVQLLLGGLVAGNDAGLVHGDWPLMSGRLFPGDYAGEGVWGTVAHSRAAVQFHHRIGAYVLFAAAIAYAVLANRRASGAPVRSAAAMLAVLVTAQAALGIATLWTGVPLLLGALHQAGAVLVLTGALSVAWRASRPGAAAAPVREAFVTGWTAPPRSA